MSLSPRFLAAAFPFLSGQTQWAVWVCCCFRVFLHLTGRTGTVTIALLGTRADGVTFGPVPHSLCAGLGFDLFAKLLRSGVCHG